MNMESGVFDGIERELKQLPRNVISPQVVEGNLEYMKRFAASMAPETLIKNVLADENLLKKISGRSYEHVNHFDKIILIDSDDPSGYRLTIHYWPGSYDERTLKQELIHNHRFSFWSHVYKGVLCTENFKESAALSKDKAVIRRYIYRPSATGNVHTCDLDGETQLDQLPNITHREGETYFLTYDSTHRVILPIDGEKICTFVLRGPRQREYTNTYNTFYPDRGIESNVPFMTPDALRQKLNEILAINRKEIGS
jgi:hypothetical protein